MKKIFVDDKRSFQEAMQASYTCVRSYEQCILLLSISKNLEVINLDYDLGSGKTGLDILRYMKENDLRPQEIILHSTHKEGVREMERYCKEHFSNSSCRYCPAKE